MINSGGSSKQVDAGGTVAAFRLRRRRLVSLLVLFAVVGISLVALGLTLRQDALLGISGFRWTIIGCALIAAGAGSVVFLGGCPACGEPAPEAFLRGRPGERCPCCGAALT